MNTEFHDLTIGTLDEKETYKRSGGFWEKVFNLEGGPVPVEWGLTFDDIWAGVRPPPPKRHARIEKGQLCTICKEIDLEEEHMDYLKSVVQQTNVRYREQFLNQPSS